MRCRVWGLMGAGALAACQQGPVPAADYGERLFHDARLSGSQYNAYSCDTCHATTPEPPAGARLSGGTLHGVAARVSFFGGAQPDLLSAVNVCFTRFMRAPEELPRDSDASRALYEYLLRLTPSREPLPARPFTVVAQVTEVPRGDAGRGQAVWKAACQGCHGDARDGRGRIAQDAVSIPDAVATYPQEFPGVSPALVVTEKVRHGRFFGIGGTMPPFSREVLSDEDVGALLAYLEL